MEYLVLLYDDEAGAPQPGTPAWDDEMAQFAAFGELADRAIRGGEALWDTSTARVVRRVDGSVQVTNGPFAEATEVLGGFFVLEAESLDDVIELARHIPTASTGALEIRPVVMQFTVDPPPSLPEDGARHLATIHGPADEEPAPDDAAWDAGAAEHQRFTESAAGIVLGGAAVHPVATATTLRVRDGELLITDGPFAEGTELTGGWYVLGGTTDAVADAAGRIPVTPNGWVEVRTILELDG